MPANEYIVGIREAVKVLDVLPTKIKDREIRRVASKALIPVSQQAKMNIRNAKYPNRKHPQREGEYSKKRLLSRGIRRQQLRGRAKPGARVVTLGPNIPMGKRDWNPQGVAKLFSAGSYKTPNRRGRGQFRGFGNWIVQAASTREGQVKLQFLTGLERIAEAARDVTIRQYGYKGKHSRSL